MFLLPTSLWQDNMNWRNLILNRCSLSLFKYTEAEEAENTMYNGLERLSSISCLLHWFPKPACISLCAKSPSVFKSLSCWFLFYFLSPKSHRSRTCICPLVDITCHKYGRGFLCAIETQNTSWFLTGLHHKWQDYLKHSGYNWSFLKTRNYNVVMPTLICSIFFF